MIRVSEGIYDEGFDRPISLYEVVGEDPYGFIQTFVRCNACSAHSEKSVTCKGTTKDPADVDAEPAGAESDIGVRKRSRSRSWNRSRNSSEAESGAGVAGATSWDNLTEDQTALTEAQLRRSTAAVVRSLGHRR